LLTASALPAKDPFNVALILADDLGSVELNCYGSDELSTPNINSLAERGVRFSQFYVGKSAICSPSRAALLTGRYPQRAQLSRNTDYTGMPGTQFTLAELFQGAGYRTADSRHLRISILQKGSS
jgi:arylsulfatase A